MNAGKLISTILVVAAIAGCATAQLDDLSEIKEPRGFSISEPIPIQLGGSAVMMSGVEAGLLPGDYVATKENKNGTFYLGSGHCVWYKGKDSYTVVFGGVWVPKSQENPTRLFSVVGYQASSAKTFTDASALCKSQSGIEQNAAPRATPSTSIEVKPCAPGASLATPQVVGGAVGSAIAQALADSARGEYQIWQKVEDPVALKRLGDALGAAGRVGTVTSPKN